MAAGPNTNIVCPVCSEYMFVAGSEDSVFLICQHAMHRSCHSVYHSSEVREDQQDSQAVNALVVEQRARVTQMEAEKMPKMDIREEKALLEELEEHALVRRAAIGSSCYAATRSLGRELH